MSVTHTHQTAIADDGSDVGANVWNADHTIAAPLTVPGTANTSSLVGTGYSLTGSNAQAMQSWSGTLNTSGVVDVIKVAITDTQRGALSSILRLQGGAAGATDLLVTYLAGHTFGGAQFVMGFDVGSSFEFYDTAANAKSRTVSGRRSYYGGGAFISAGNLFAWGPSSGDVFGIDTGLSRIAAGVVAIGNGTQGSTVGQMQVATVRTISTVVGSLPAAATAGAGSRAFVTDATQTMTAGIGAAVVGGGANKVPVYCDGTGWFIG